MKKRLYHEDGRAFTEEEYAEVAARQAKRKAFWVRAAKDFAVIWVIVAIYDILFSFLLNNVSLTEYFKIIPLSLALNLPQSLILTSVFVYCVRILRSGFWYFLISLTLTVWMFIYSVENTATIHLKIAGIYYNIGGDHTIVGLLRRFFNTTYYLFTLFSLSLFLYNPFKSLK